MKFLPLIIANIKRKKIRTVLTLGSFAVSLFLFGLLVTIDAAFYQGLEVAGVDRLIVSNKTSLIMPLPVSYKERLRQIPGVEDVTYASWFGGIYQDEKNFFPQFAIDTETWLGLYPEFIIPEQQWQAFEKDRQGAIVGRKTMKRFKWKVGDRIPLQATIYRGIWEFNICGVYNGTRKADDLTQFWFHHKYLDENTPFEKGYVGWYTVKVKDPDQAAQVSRAIDDRFANSPFETKTDTEKAFTAGFVKQFGNIKLILLSVGAVVFFTLLLITGSNMGISVRERTNEIAILKTVGFTDQKVVFLILLESTLYALVGGGLGLGLCKLFTLAGDPTGGLLPLFYLAADRIALGVGIAFLVGVTAGFIPALFAMKLKIVDAMRRV
ncbi:ABC transporter permease [candidate division CSSED10-310 bacterium]|uniref:ABC transporter permease n=1 Tax=candidate division CSSED10-310 bacterium TaxID=2855610 RepID=A0ABV6YZK3_UNCC1